MLCGSAFKNKGVQPLLDAVVDYLPSPLDVPPVKGIDLKGNEVERMPSDDEPIRCSPSRSWPTRSSAPHLLPHLFRHAASGTGVINSTKDNERVGRMLLMHANHREDIKEAYAGDIVALAGLKDTRTGDTLCDPQKPVILEKMEFPDPVIEIAIEPKSKADQEKLGVALAKLVAEDPSFRVTTDQESGQTIIKGMGELHLDIKVDLLKRTYKVDANIGAPQVAYRETLIAPAKSTTRIRSRPAAPASSRASRSCSSRCRPAGLCVRERGRRRRGAEGIRSRRREGPQSCSDTGVLAGFPAIDFKASLIDGEYHDVDSAALAFEIAARAAFREGAAEGRPVLLEPIMKVEVVTPEDSWAPSSAI